MVRGEEKKENFAFGDRRGSTYACPPLVATGLCSGSCNSAEKKLHTVEISTGIGWVLALTHMGMGRVTCVQCAHGGDAVAVCLG